MKKVASTTMEPATVTKTQPPTTTIKIIDLIDMLEQCITPVLPVGIGTREIVEEDFKEFKVHLNEFLPKVFRGMQQFKPYDEYFRITTETLGFRTYFLIVYFEQTSDCTLFRCDELYYDIFTQFEQLQLNNVLHKDSLSSVLQYFKKCLSKEHYKFSFASIYGFQRFCELYYDKGNNEIDLDTAMFALSVGTINLEQFELKFKKIGIYIYHLLICRVSKANFFETNINDLIMKKLMKVRETIKDDNLNESIWNCFYSYISIYNRETFISLSKWNYLDQIFDSLRVPNFDIVKLLLYFAKFSLIDVRRQQQQQQQQQRPGLTAAKTTTVKPNSKVIVEGDDGNDIQKVDRDLLENAVDYRLMTKNVISQWEKNTWNDSDYVKRLRGICKNHTNMHMYRWIRKVLKLILMQSVLNMEFEQLALLLRSIHIFYLTCVYPTPIELCRQEVNEFSPEFFKFLSPIIYQSENGVFMYCEIKSIAETMKQHFIGE